MGAEERKHEPIQQSVHVDCPVEEAFRLFTEGLGEWWPLKSHSVAEDEAESCEMEPWEGGRVLERTRFGEEHEWGSVSVWDPPRRVELTWHPGEPAGGSQTVDVEFLVDADGTRVIVTHHGWQFAGAARCSIQACAPQWHTLLSRFREFAAAEMLVTRGS